ncbi:sensor histidine kinase [Chloroflexota bacterium]
MLKENHQTGEFHEHQPDYYQNQIDELTSNIQSLEKTSESLRSELEQLKKEQITYLQNVSHQIVAPLHAMKMHIENLRYGRISNPDRVRKVLRSIYSQATISVHLAKNFSLMSNLEADQTLTAQQEPLEPIRLIQLMINLADDFQPSSWEKNVQITVVDYLLETAPPVLAMKSLISQVFSNIIENAVKYSHDNTEIKISGRFNKDDTVTVIISNKGIPLVSGAQELLFTRGYRSIAAKNAYPAGTGFGLYIAKKIVEIHEGNITAYTYKDSTVFEVTLSVKGLEGKAISREAKNDSYSR